MIWVRIPGTAYEASNEGDVRRADPACGAVVGRVLKPYKSGGRGGNRYLYVTLSHEGVKTQHLVHRLVAHAFVGPAPGEDWQVDHKDRNRYHNDIGNLEWVSPEENQRRRSGAAA